MSNESLKLRTKQFALWPPEKSKQPKRPRSCGKPVNLPSLPLLQSVPPENREAAAHNRKVVIPRSALRIPHLASQSIFNFLQQLRV
jgi:hypothetical protein